MEGSEVLRLSFETRKFVSDKKDSLVGSSDELKFLQLSRSCSRVSVLQVEEHNEMVIIAITTLRRLTEI